MVLCINPLYVSVGQLVERRRNQPSFITNVSRLRELWEMKHICACVFLFIFKVASWSFVGPHGHIFILVSEKCFQMINVKTSLNVTFQFYKSIHVLQVSNY